MPIHCISPLLTLSFVIYFIRSQRLEENHQTVVLDTIAVRVFTWLVAIFGAAFASAFYGSPKDLSFFKTCCEVGYRILIQMRIDASVALATLVTFAVISEKEGGNQ